MEYLEPDYLVADFFVTNLEFLIDRASKYQIDTKTLIDVADLYIRNKCFRRDTGLLITKYTNSHSISEESFDYLLRKFTRDPKFYVQVHNILELQGKRLIREYKQKIGDVS